MERSSRIFVHYVDEQIIKDIAGNWDFALVSVAVLSLDCWFQRCSKSLCGCFLNGCILRISKSCCSSQRTDLCTKYCPLVKHIVVFPAVLCFILSPQWFLILSTWQLNELLNFLNRLVCSKRE